MAIEDQNIGSPNEQIEFLRSRIKELEAAETLRPHGETVKEAVKELGEKRPADVPVPAPTFEKQAPPPQPTETGKEEGIDIVVDEHGPEMQKYLQLVEDKGAWYALDVVRRMNLHMLDDFHAVLAQYFQAKHHL